MTGPDGSLESTMCSTVSIRAANCSCSLVPPFSLDTCSRNRPKCSSYSPTLLRMRQLTNGIPCKITMCSRGVARINWRCCHHSLRMIRPLHAMPACQQVYTHLHTLIILPH